MALLTYKRPFSRSYENEFFREFATALSSLFHRKGWNGVLFGSPEIESEPTLQIDALLISERHICLIDFKNYGGTIKLPNSQQAFENHAWFTAAGEMVRGGNSINPFIQLKKQNTKLIQVIDQEIYPLLESGDSIHTYQLKRIVCFQKEMKFDGGVPSRREMTFFLADVHSILGKIEDILDVEGSSTRISTTSLRKMGLVFKAPEFVDNKLEQDIAPSQKAEPISLRAVEVTEPDEEKLSPTSDQKEILEKFADFLHNEDQQVFIILGSSQSGKSSMIPMLRDVAFQNELKDIELLAPTSRMASAAGKESGEEVHSLYSYMYERKKKSIKEVKEESDNVEEEIEEAELDQLNYVFPLRGAPVDERAVFIIEDAQQLGDSFVQIEDFTFGSGHLLQDFIRFAQFREKNRKCVMLGDPYLVSNLGQERAIAPAYLKEAYGLGVEAYMLSPNKPGKSESSMLGQSLNLTSAIDKDIFNQLYVQSNDEVQQPEREQVFQILKHEIDHNFWDFKFLTFSHKQALEVNLWIKQDIFGSGKRLNPGDLVLFHKSMLVKNEHPLVNDYYIRNGDVLQVSGLEEVYLTPPIKLKGRKHAISLHMQEIKVKRRGDEREVCISIILDYLERESPDLYKDELLVLKVLFARQVNDAIKKEPLEQSEFYSLKIKEQGKPKNDKELKKRKREYRKHIEEKLRPYSPYANYGLVRYGWSVNVHKAVPFKFRHIILSCDYKHDQRGTDNAAYFSWLYSGMTRAQEKLYLLGLQNFNCLKKAELKTAEPLSDFSIPARKKSLDIMSPASEAELAFAREYQMNLEKVALIRYALLLSARLNPSGIKLKSVTQHNYQEMYALEKAGQLIGKLKVFYNGKWQFKDPVPEKINKDHEASILKALKEDFEPDPFSEVRPSWKKDFYQQLSQALEQKGLQLKCIDYKNDYLDRIYIQYYEDVLLVDMHCNKEGFFSSIICKSPADTPSWSHFQECINSLKTLQP